MSIRMIEDVFAAALSIQSFCHSQKWKFCFIGGLAVLRWGTPRVTQDADLTLLADFGTEMPFIDAILKTFVPRVPNAKAFALQNRVILAQTSSGIHLDIALGALPFEERSVIRASIWHATESVALLTCSADDLIVHKIVAGRGKDWDDVQSILARQNGKLNFKQIQSELTPLLELKDDTESLTRLDRMVEKVKDRLR
jgi:hypothetical protein